MMKYLIYGLAILYACSHNAPKEGVPVSVSDGDSSSMASTVLSTTENKSPVLIDWKWLADVDYTETYVAEVQSDIAFPIFTDKIKQLHGRTVIIEGYVIPIEETLENAAIILSAFPYTQCFFCGLAGPESVMDIIPLNHLKGLSTDEKVQFKGKLKLNDTNWEQLIYILEDAEIVP